MCLWIRTTAWVFVLPMILAGVGCQHHGPYTVNVRLDDSLRDPTSDTMPALDVDLVAINHSEAALKDVPVSAYFQPGSAQRRSADAYNLKFGPDAPAEQSLPDSADVWEQWLAKQATELVVLVNLPGANTGRMVLPLDSKRWGTREIDVVVRSGGVSSPTPMEPAD